MEKKKIGNLQSYIVQSPHSNRIDSAVILVHGYGANGRDLISLGDEWFHKNPNTLFIAPDAPFTCEASPFGLQWISLNDFTKPAMEKQIQQNWHHLSDYIDAVINDFKIPDNRIILCGFSQGTMMALYTALSREKACAGVLGYSGMLLCPEIVTTTQHKTMPIALIHGSEDPVIPVEEWEDAMTIFKSNGFLVTGHKSKGLAHGINESGIESGNFFIHDCLTRNAI